MHRGGAGRASDRPPFFSERGRRPRWPRTAWFSSCKHCSQCSKSCRLWLKVRGGRKVRAHRIAHAFPGIDLDRTPQRSFNGRTRKYRRALSTQHDLHRSDYWDQPPEHKVQAVRGHRGRRPPSLKKGGRSEARREPPRRFWHLARQRLGPDTSRGRPGARHPPLRGDSATPGRLPAGLRRRLDHDGQARCLRPA